MLRILFVKTSSLGDVVHQCPALSDVARHIRDAQIDWVVEESFAAVAEMHRNVRHVIPVAVRRWRKALWRPSVWKEITAFRRRIAAERYDIVIDSQGLLKSALLSVLAHGERHGLDALSAREPIAARFYDVTHAVRPELHPVERNRILAAAALHYAPGGPFKYGLVSSGARPLALNAPYAVLLSMTSRREKLWPIGHWIELAGALGRRGLRVVLPHGAESERLRSQQIADSNPAALVPPFMPIADVARLMRGACGVVGLDTGLLHLAAGLGVPAVGVYSGTDPARFGLYASPQSSARARNVGSRESLPSAHQVLGAFEEIALA